MKRTYSNDKITVYWDSDKCIKSGECHSCLPQVFDVNRRPWVNLDAADVEEIRRTIDACPTGALSYVMHDQPASDAITIQVMKDGPLKDTDQLCQAVVPRDMKYRSVGREISIRIYLCFMVS